MNRSFRIYFERTILTSFLKKIPVAIAIVLLLLPLSVANGHAETIVQQERPVIQALKSQADSLAQQIKDSGNDDAALVNLRMDLDAMAKKLIDVGVSFRPRLTEINAQLDQLGQPPAVGQPAEPPLVTQQRNQLLSEKAEINALIGQTEDLSVRVNRMSGDINGMRRDLFAHTLSKRVDINYAFGSEVVTSARGEAAAVGQAFSGWWRYVVSFRLRAILMATFLALLIALGIHYFGRRLLGTLYLRDGSDESPSYLNRLSVAFWSTLIPSASVGVFLATTYFLFGYFDVLWDDIATLLLAGFKFVGVVYFVHRLASAILSPDMANWRLVRVASRPSHVLLWLLTATAFVTGLDFVLNTVNGVFSTPLALTVAKSLVSTLLVGGLMLAIAFLRPFDGEETGASRRWPAPVRYLLVAIGLMLITSALLGYIGLARFVAQQVVINGAVLVTMYLGVLTARAISGEAAFGSTALGQHITERFHLDETSLDQFGLVAGMTINLLVLVIGVPLILLELGFQWSEIESWFYGIASEIRIGSVSFSLIGVFSGVLVFFVGYFITRWFQGWLDGSVMARGRIDSGVRNSIKTAVGYLGIGIAVLIGISAAGINLSSLALVAGALSVGIGFGLQNVVSNFVSGLILLAERPFKVGDWIEAGGTAGIVKKISVRATELETFHRQSVIVPNSELINAKVGNWTHRNKLGRVDVPVGVAYSSDARRVYEILLEIARAHPLVLRNPEPYVYFSGFGDSALQFQLRVHLADIYNIVRVESDLRFAILDRFREEGIEIPFPQRDVNLKIEKTGEAATIERIVEARRSAPPEFERPLGKAKAKAKGEAAE
jgi:potassium-dependent mechanosensitive channel